MDVVTPFLQGELNEEIYMKQPEGYDDKSGRVCKLNKSIYGLKQAGRVWNIKLDKALYRFGLQRAKNDACIYYNKTSTLFVAVYLDDFLIFHTTKDELNEIREFLHNTFRMKDIGNAKTCVGINITVGENFIELDQSRYIEKILDRFGMTDSKPVKTPCDLNQKLSAKMSPKKFH